MYGPALVGEPVVEEEGQTAHYLSRVLRLAENAEVILFNGDGQDYRCRVSSFSKNSIEATVLESIPNHSESALKITLAQGLSRGERMDYSLQKATELGVAAVHPLVTERVEVRLTGNRLQKRLDHWRGPSPPMAECF